MKLTTDRDELRGMIEPGSIRGKALMLMLDNGPMTIASMSRALDLPNKSLSSNLNAIKQDATYIELKITKDDNNRNKYELVGLYRPMGVTRTRGGKKMEVQPVGMLEQSFQSAFSAMNKLQIGI